MAGYFKTPNAQQIPVEHSDESSPEVGKPLSSSLPEVAPPYHIEKIAYGNNGMSQRTAFIVSRKRLYIGLAVTIIVIIAAIAGAVIGVLQHNKKSQESEHNSANNGSRTNPRNGASLWKDSAIGVTGWRHGSEYRIRLFYQDEGGYLRMSFMESPLGEVWVEKISTFGKAKLGTPIVATSHNRTIYEPDKNSMQVHVFYLDENSILQEYIISWDGKRGQMGPLNDRKIKVAPDTRLAAYWPSVVYQNPDNSISELRYNCTSGKTDDCWQEQNLNISGPSSSTALAEVPKGRNLTGLWLYYQKYDGGLVNFSWDNETGTWGDEHFATPIPQSAPLSVLADPRNENGPFLNFVAVWQNPSNAEIQYSWRNKNNWSEHQSSPAFSDAKNGTSLACLTAASWWDRKLEDESELSRCFFFEKGGRLRQAQWLGQVWQDLGLVGIEQEKLNT